MCSRGQERPRGLHLWLHCLVGLILLLLQKDIRFAVLERNLKSRSRLIGRRPPVICKVTAVVICCNH